MSHQILSKAIIAPKNIILNPSEIKRLALFFEGIIIYDLAGKEIKSHEQEFYNSELSFLRENGLVLLAGFQPLATMTFQRSDGSIIDIESDIKNKYDILFSPELIMGKFADNAKTKAEKDFAIIKHLASQFEYNSAPITTHGTIDFNSPGEKNAIEVAVKNVPMPPDNIPWQDLLQYRNDEETKHKLTALRIWIQNQHISGKHPAMMKEELEYLIHEYENHMRLLSKKYQKGIIKGLITASTEAILEITRLNLVGVYKALSSFEIRSIDKEIAETQAPGKEVSYISRTKSFIEEHKGKYRE